MKKAKSKPEFHSKTRRLIRYIPLAEYLRKYENYFYKTALTHGTSKETKERKKAGCEMRPVGRCVR